MTLALRLALRNLLRAPRRSALTLAAGAGGLAVAMILVNLARGIADQAVEDAVRLGPGHLGVHRAGYLPLGDTARDLPRADDLARRIAALPEVRAVLPRLTSPALARTGSSARAVLLLGVDPRGEAAISPIARRLSSGGFLDASGPGTVLLGTALAGELGVRVGDDVLLSVPGGPGGADERALRVGGILDPGLDEIAPGTVWLRLDDARQLTGRTRTAHEIAVFLHSSGQASQAARDAVRSRIAALVDPAEEIEITEWRESLPQLRDALALDALGRRILVAGLFAIIAIGAAATILASVLERTRELGLLLALGAPPALLLRMILAEGAMLGLCSVALGLAAGSAATAVLARTGLDARPFFQEEIAYGGALFSLKILPAWDWRQTLHAALLLLAAHLAAAAWPARRAAATPAAEAMRFR